MASNIKTITIDEPYLKLKCGLGEGPHWEEKHNSLRFIDVVKRQVHYIDVEKGPESHRVQQFEYSFGTTADIEGDDERFIFSGKHGFGIANRTTGNWKYIKSPWTEDEINEGKENHFRANDGGVDPSGRLIASWMNEPLVRDPGAEGVLFRLDSDLSLHRLRSEITIPNGSRWSPSGTTFYFADSPTRTISSFTYDAASGTMSDPQPYYTVPEDTLPGGGVPDGFAVDENGDVWVAVHGRGVVVQVSPEGEVRSRIELPTRWVTCPVFVGDELFITSMQDYGEGEGEAVVRSKELAGSVFRVKVGVKGAKIHRFRPAEGVALPQV